MALDSSLIGQTRPGGTLLVTRSRLRVFAKATGQTDPVFTDVEAARRAGHHDLPVPPTFYFGVDLEMPDPLGYLTEIGVDPRALLHGEQEFTYHGVAHAGDELTSSSTVADVFEKRGGALKFLVTDVPIADQHGTTVVTMRSTLVVRELNGVNA
ncbi:MaoC family dehydratase N-terminal domain-containing protein [Actinomadura sp. 7K507]|uniref:MaoC family dehydratase N-terminal domain-containing protein n=1 Tax=Actinomadura sp. 7K507 TaxID=2530365 RepID=UPI00104A9712|nr:MaoC family dehydratase N-terminal domain-containing protein [Actinomadura sp. 7K507]TDC88530.1 MaoC family dehydratase [Actinomadura sp. 7K507]